MEAKTIDAIQNLTDAEVDKFLHLKWVAPIVFGIENTMLSKITSLSKSSISLAEKYALSYISIEKNIDSSEKELADLLSELTGETYAIKGLTELANRIK